MAVTGCESNQKLNHHKQNVQLGTNSDLLIELISYQAVKSIPVISCSLIEWPGLTLWDFLYMSWLSLMVNQDLKQVYKLEGFTEVKGQQAM